MKEIIEKALNSSDLDNKLNDAAELKVKISMTLKEDGKEILNSFVEKMININPEIRSIYLKGKKKRTEEETDKLSTFINLQKKKFKAVKSVIFPVVKPDGSVVQPLEKMIGKLSEIYQMLVYLGNEDILDLFKTAKLSFDLPKLEDEKKEFANEDVREYLKYIFQSAKENNEEIQNTKNQIKNEIYMELDPAIRYSPENKEGLKSPQFEQLASQKAIALMKSSDDYTKFKEKKLEKDEANLVSLNIALEKAKEI